VYDAGHTVRTGGSAYGWVHTFQGMRHSATTGLHQTLTRDYSPALGRWASTDPIGFTGGDANLYAFVGNAPAGWVDPSGLSQQQIGGGGGLWGGGTPDEPRQVDEQEGSLFCPAPSAQDLLNYDPDKTRLVQKSPTWEDLKNYKPGAENCGLLDWAQRTGSAIVDGVWTGIKNMVGGAKDTGFELLEVGRDVGKAIVSGVTQVANAVADTGVYYPEYKSDTMIGYEQAIRNGNGGSYLANVVANGASFGIKPLIEGIIDYAVTGDATRASRTAGGVAATNLAAAGLLKGFKGASGPHYTSSGAGTVPGVGTKAVTPFGFGMKKGVAGKHPALMIDGKVYAHHHHIAAQELARTRPKPTDLYGWVELDANGKVIWAEWVPLSR
jgi:RHS repeat-associated protein